MTTASAPTVLLAKPGLDGHDRGIKVVAMALREVGAEVIYLGLRQTPKQIAAAARDEDADVIGLSILSGAHIELCTAVVNECAAHGVGDIPVVVGGTIPPADVETLHNIGVAAAFPVGSSLEVVVNATLHAAGAREGRRA